MAERSDNVNLQEDAIDAHNDALARLLLENGDAALTAPNAEVSAPDVKAPAVDTNTPAAAPVDVKVEEVSIDTLAAIAAVDVKTPVAPEPKRYRCSVLDGFAIFACPLCNNTGYERSSVVNAGHITHRNSFPNKESTDVIENMYIKAGVVGCGKQLRIVARQVAAETSPGAEPRTVTEHYVEEIL